MGQSIPPGATTLKQFVDNLSHRYPQMRVTLAVEGLESFLRYQSVYRTSLQL